MTCAGKRQFHRASLRHWGQIWLTSGGAPDSGPSLGGIPTGSGANSAPQRARTELLVGM
jgi:hypothetical protein